MQGLLVHGSNHFIVRGPLPDLGAARRLVSLWEIPQLDELRRIPPALPWSIVEKAFREDLCWAVVLENGEKPSPAVARLLEELAGRGVAIYQGPGPWLAEKPSPWKGDHFPEVITETPRLVIREMTQADADAVEGMLGDADVMLYFGKLFGREQVRDWIERHIALYEQDGCAYWLVFEKATGKAVGQAGILRQVIEERVEFGLGYIFHKDSWGQGLASEAARACLDYAFNKLGKARIVVTIRPENRPSQRLMERLSVEPERKVQYSGFEHLLYVVSRDERQWQTVP
jgi:RimJ/RimL family protein N-acetyltransferase